MADQHFHNCPECFKKEPCTLDCAIEADLSEGWNETTQEFAQPFGATTECEECLRKAGVVSFLAHRARRNAKQPEPNPEGLTLIPVFVPEWRETVCLMTDKFTAERTGAVLVAPPHFCMRAEDVREYAISILWSAIHASCAECRAGQGWCAAHATDEELFAQIEKHIDAALASRIPACSNAQD